LSANGQRNAAMSDVCERIWPMRWLLNDNGRAELKAGDRVFRW